ncbi:MAG: TRAP transporter large permease subunit [SAR202 cluster bacterium]|jgi:tripartite ATP-independent transporter DctM subunit|nr:TRAP transporter large permease subunit [SAR202 cluster bacterium]
MDVNHILIVAMFVTFILLLFSGYPIPFVLAGVSALFTLIGYLADLYLGTSTGVDYMYVGMVVNRIFKLMDNWVLVAIPMFIFMGLMLDRSGVAERMMGSIQDMFGRVRGGLAVTVTAIGIVLAASTGIIGASVVLLGLLAIPTMLRQGYDKSFAAGTVAAAGTLGILIPPSIMLVIMADQLGLSVGDLFMGAVFPGLILGGMYIVYILLISFLDPNKAPLPDNRSPLSFGVVWNVLKTALPAVLLILAVLGSIFAGVTTVTEASGVGALGAIVLAAINKKLDFKTLKEVIHDTFNTTGYIFGIFIGATCFALVLRGLGGDDLISMALTGLPFGSYGTIMALLLIIFLLGFFLDWIEITLIVLPLLTPVVASLNIQVNGFGVVDNPEMIWFLLLVAMALQTSFLTPPVGFAIFYLRGVAPADIQLGHIYRGVIPFIVLQLIALTMLVIWPGLVTWLPAVAYGN